MSGRSVRMAGVGGSVVDYNSPFWQHVREASAIVDTWPKWKQNVLGRVIRVPDEEAIPMKDVKPVKPAVDLDDLRAVNTALDEVCKLGKHLVGVKVLRNLLDAKLIECATWKDPE